MDRNAILNAMERRAKALYEGNNEYVKDGKRGFLVVQMRDAKNPVQWESTMRSFGDAFRDYGYDDDLVVNNGTNFDALAHAKLAFSRRTNLNSGTNYYQVLGHESWWRGSVTSDDGNCICGFAGLSSSDDELIAQQGINCYESLKRNEEKSKADAEQAEAEPEEDAEADL